MWHPHEYQMPSLGAALTRWIPNAGSRSGNQTWLPGVANTALHFLRGATRPCLLFVSRWWDTAIVTLAEIRKRHPNHQMQGWNNEEAEAHHPGRCEHEDVHLVCKVASKHFIKGDNFLWPMNILFISDSGPSSLPPAPPVLCPSFPQYVIALVRWWSPSW